MIKYIRIKSQKGTKNKSIILREKPSKFSKTCKEKYISKKRNVLIFGMHASGKSKELQKIYEKHNEIFASKEPLLFLGTDSISDWMLNANETHHRNHILSIADETEKETLIHDSKKQYAKILALTHASRSAVVYIDDLDKIQGKKKEIIKKIIKNSSLVIATAKNERDIDKTILAILQSRGGFTEINLATHTAYDATNIIFITAIIAMIATGMHELALLVMAGRYIAKPKSTK